MSRRHQPARDASVRRAAAPSRLPRALDPPDVGGRIGVLGGRPPGTRTLAAHPQGPGRVPAGAVSPDRRPWPPARTSSRVPVPALATRVRGLWRALVRQPRPDRSLPASVWAQGGGVSCTPALHGPETGLTDWGRSVHRSALPQRRRLAIADGPRGCRARDAPAPRGQTMTRPADACIRRLLPPGWPQGFPHVRAAGRWRPVPRPLRPHLQRGLAGHAPAAPRASPDRERPPPAGA